MVKEVKEFRNKVSKIKKSLNNPKDRRRGKREREKHNSNNSWFPGRCLKTGALLNFFFFFILELFTSFSVMMPLKAVKKAQKVLFVNNI